MEKIIKKYEALKKHMRTYKGVAVAFSGGVDSALVLKVAVEGLGDRVVAITADNPALPREELRHAQRLAASMNAKHVILKTYEIENENYTANPVNRCYFCKSELYGRIQAFLRGEGLAHTILNGTNEDDLGDYRPGLKAAEERGVRSPLVELHWKKADVRSLARALNLEVWDKPSSPCLASRIPYHQQVTKAKLASIEKAEHFLRGLDIRQLRVRHFGDRARIDVEQKDKEKLLKNWKRVEAEFGKIGFQTIHWQPFKSGSLNILAHGNG
jgi:uncharacterized protein